MVGRHRGYGRVRADQDDERGGGGTSEGLADAVGRHQVVVHARSDDRRAWNRRRPLDAAHVGERLARVGRSAVRAVVERHTRDPQVVGYVRRDPHTGARDRSSHGHVHDLRRHRCRWPQRMAMFEKADSFMSVVTTVNL